jgi:outer membrane protein
MKTTLAAARLAALVMLCLLAVRAHAIDLIAAYEHALAHDPAHLAAVEALTAGREKAIQGDSLLLPRINLQSSLSRVDDRSSNNVPSQQQTLLPSGGTGTVRETGLQLVQPLYNVTAHAEKSQLYQQSSLALTQFNQKQQDLVQRVSEAYFGVLLAQEALRVVQAEKFAIGLQRDRAQARFDIGRGKVTELQEAKARFDAVTTKEVSALSTLVLRQAQFTETTGLPAEGLAKLARSFVPRAPEPDNLQVWQRKGEEDNMRVLAKRSELAIASAEINKHRLAGRPTLDLVANYTEKDQQGTLSPLLAPDGSRIAAIGLQLNLPLYAGGAINSREREAIAKQQQAEQELAAAQRDVRLQVLDGFLAVKTGVSRVTSLEQSLASAQTALEATTLGRDVGTRTELDVLDAQQRTFDAELDLTQARFEYLLGRIRLSLASGELGQTELQAVNAWLMAP